MNSVKLQVVLEPDVLFPQSQKQWAVFQKSSLNYKFSCKCDVCYIVCTTQRLDIRMNQHIPLNIHTNISNYTAEQSNQNSSSTIVHYLLGNLACAAAYRPTMFTILRTSSDELQLSILEALLIMKHKPKLYIPKQFYAPLLFNNLIEPHKENIITHASSSGLLYFLNQFSSFLPSRLFWWSLSNVYFLWYRLECHWHNSLERSDQNKGSLFRI